MRDVFGVAAVLAHAFAAYQGAGKTVENIFVNDRFNAVERLLVVDEGEN